MADPFRYMLTRSLALLWPDDAMGLLFVMLNPSTATDTKDDPTIRRCVGFGAREKAPFIAVANLYAFRATDPLDLARAADPLGPHNDAILRTNMGIRHMRIVCAWGANSAASKRLARFAELHADAGAPPLWCLGTTKDGAPRHPLYVKADQPLVPFEVSHLALRTSKDGVDGSSALPSVRPEKTATPEGHEPPPPSSTAPGRPTPAESDPSGEEEGRTAPLRSSG